LTWDDIFTRNVFVTLGVTFVLVISYVVISLVKKLFDAAIEYGKAHISKLNDMADLVPAMKEDLDRMTIEIKGLRKDLRDETADKLKVQIEKDSHLETRIMELEAHKRRHNIHNLSGYTHLLGANLEALVAYTNKVTAVVGVGIAPFELRMPELRSDKDRRKRHSGFDSEEDYQDRDRDRERDRDRDYEDRD
jgi:hypothetical protein